MPTFQPPTQNAVPPILPDGNPEQTSIQKKLFSNMRSRPEGINVFIYSDNTVSTEEPDGTTTLWHESDRTSDCVPGCPHVVLVAYGGHEAITVTAAQAALLTAAGYTVT